jgi:hypothetical protein
MNTTTTPMEADLRHALRELVAQCPASETWPPAITAKRNAEALLSGRLRPADYLAHAVDVREIA